MLDALITGITCAVRVANFIVFGPRIFCLKLVYALLQKGPTLYLLVRMHPRNQLKETVLRVCVCGALISCFTFFRVLYFICLRSSDH